VDAGLARSASRFERYSHASVVRPHAALDHLGLGAQRIAALAFGQRQWHDEVKRPPDPDRTLRLSERQCERGNGEPE